MIAGLDTNILIMIAVGLIVVVLLAWFLLHGRGGADAGLPPEPSAERKPLEPVKPKIDLATPMAFDIPKPEPVAVPLASDSTGRPAIAAAVGAPDDLRRIKGLGPKLATLLSSLGVTRFDQIAAWSDAEIAEVDRFLGDFQGRIARDNWVEQAGYLAKGDETGFAARFGSLGS
jgi:predicted flap endonuclease-1-like 5' DNA nuclease